MVVRMALSPFAEWLGAELAKRGLNRSQLGVYIGKPPQTVSAWFVEGRQPRTDACEAIAAFLKVPLDLVLEKAGHRRTGAYSPPPVPEWLISELVDLTEPEQLMIRDTARAVRELREGYSATPPGGQTQPSPAPSSPRPRRTGPRRGQLDQSEYSSPQP